MNKTQIFELEKNSNSHGARVLLQRSLRYNPQSQALWSHYFNLEVWNTLRILERQNLLELEVETSLLESTPIVVFKHAINNVQDCAFACKLHKASIGTLSYTANIIERMIIEKFGLTSELKAYLVETHSRIKLDNGLLKIQKCATSEINHIAILAVSEALAEASILIQKYKCNASLLESEIDCSSVVEHILNLKLCEQILRDVTTYLTDTLTALDTKVPTTKSSLSALQHTINSLWTLITATDSVTMTMQESPNKLHLRNLVTLCQTRTLFISNLLSHQQPEIRLPNVKFDICHVVDLLMLSGNSLHQIWINTHKHPIMHSSKFTLKKPNRRTQSFEFPCLETISERKPMASYKPAVECWVTLIDIVFNSEPDYLRSENEDCLPKHRRKESYVASSSIMNSSIYTLEISEIVTICEQLLSYSEWLVAVKAGVSTFQCIVRNYVTAIGFDKTVRNSYRKALTTECEFELQSDRVRLCICYLILEQAHTRFTSPSDNPANQQQFLVEVCNDDDGDDVVDFNAASESTKIGAIDWVLHLFESQPNLFPKDTLLPIYNFVIPVLLSQLQNMIVATKSKGVCNYSSQMNLTRKVVEKAVLDYPKESQYWLWYEQLELRLGNHQAADQIKWRSRKLIT